MLRDELAELFQPEFFPANKSDMVLQILDNDGCSLELSNLIINLEDDDDFKYNSIDDILPMPSLTDYPFYTTSCGDYHKILSKSTAILVDPKQTTCVSPSIYFTSVEENVQRWHKFERSTKQEFMSAYHEAQKNLRSLIFNDIKQKVE